MLLSEVKGLCCLGKLNANISTLNFAQHIKVGSMYKFSLLSCFSCCAVQEEL